MPISKSEREAYKHAFVVMYAICNVCIVVHVDISLYMNEREKQGV